MDGSGNVIIGSGTSSPDFPTANAAQDTYGGGGRDAFVAKLGPTLDERVDEIIDAIEGLISNGVLNGGQGNALISKLEAALEKIAQGNSTAAINQLNAFINQVTDFIDSGTLTSEEGQPLIDAAEALIAALS